ncbi:MAG: 3-isopropylmalate dehydratase large subunit [Sphingomonadaceae bacterium]|nr:3-isopropylmalate dehydratase large subunit [Sphingomonadaceae bacterium]
MKGGNTTYDKIWDDHVVEELPDGTARLLIDRKLVYEAGSVQVFRGIRAAGRSIPNPERVLAVPDHVLPTHDRSPEALAGMPALLLEELERNSRDFGIEHIPLFDERQGIAHVVGPEQGFTLPGTTIVCHDSHTATHGAFGALAFGVGASEFEHIMVTQTLLQRRSDTMRIGFDGVAPAWIGGKDLILAAIGTIGARGGTGYAIEFAGEAIAALSMEGRMTMCNMAIEAGARVGLIAPDETTYRWLNGRPKAPKGAMWEQALAYWRTLPSGRDARFDREVLLDVSALAPQVTWGTSPEHVVGIDGRVPDPKDAGDAAQADAWTRALDYMGLAPGTAMADVAVSRVFIGSCTNSRIEDLRSAAAVLKGRKIADGVHAFVSPGSGLVKKQAEAEGLDRIFTEAGFEWRLPGCSMCFGGPFDSLKPGERCASTSNRNFENRQGRDGRTHLVSPAMAAAAAVTGRLADVRDYL